MFTKIYSTRGIVPYEWVWTNRLISSGFLYDDPNVTESFTMADPFYYVILIVERVLCIVGGYLSYAESQFWRTLIATEVHYDIVLPALGSLHSVDARASTVKPRYTVHIYIYTIETQTIYTTSSVVFRGARACQSNFCCWRFSRRWERPVPRTSFPISCRRHVNCAYMSMCACVYVYCVSHIACFLLRVYGHVANRRDASQFRMPWTEIRQSIHNFFLRDTIIINNTYMDKLGKLYYVEVTISN